MSHNPLNALTKRVAELEKFFHLLRNTPWQQDVESAGGNADSQQEQKEIGQNTAILLHGNPARIHGNNPEHKWYNSRQWWKSKSFQWYKDRFEIIALIAGIGYAVVTYLQWRDLRHNFTLDERSWIEFKLKDEKAPVSSFDSAYLPVDMINIGKTPARNVVIISNGEVLARDAAPSFNYSNGLQTTTVLGLLFPNMPLDIHAGNLIPLSEKQRLDLASGKAYIVGYAIVTWGDIFGTSHWMHFCARHTFAAGTTNAKTCSDYNDTDAR
jgi:hypothetical protein